LVFLGNEIFSLCISKFVDGDLFNKLIFAIIDIVMALRSELLTIDLPDSTGKTSTYYTYDGYLEEADRNNIRNQRKSLESLKVTGAAILGWTAFIVYTN
jgi:hypothetical protein